MQHIRSLMAIGWPNREKQKDCIAGWKDAETDSILLAVADGHRENGFAVAWRAIDEVRKYAEDETFSFMSIQSLRRMYLDIDRQISAELRDRPALGGSTLTMIYLSPREYAIANVGDSPAGVIHENGSVDWLTETHNTSNSDECARLDKLGYDFHTSRRNSARYYYHPCNYHSFTHLAVTRAIGDWDFRGGFVADPFVKIAREPLPGKRLLICTDGVIDTLEYHKRYLGYSMLVDKGCFSLEASQFIEAIEENAVENVSGFIVDLDAFYGR